MPFTIKLEQPEKFEGQMDHEVLATFVWQCENYFALTGLADAGAQARFASMLLTKSASVWLRHQNYAFNTLTWNQLKSDMQQYFKPADFHRRARDRLARCQQTHSVARYIDAMKRIAQQVNGVTDDEMLDRFVCGLKPAL